MPNLHLELWACYHFATLEAAEQICSGNRFGDAIPASDEEAALLTKSTVQAHQQIRQIAAEQGLQLSGPLDVIGHMRSEELDSIAKRSAFLPRLRAALPSACAHTS